MRASKKEYEEVAKRCSSFESREHSTFTNSDECNCTSCLNCAHFSSDEHCVLDLYDQIIQNL